MKLDHALALAEQGFRVFPITANASSPPAFTDWQTLATTDVDTIRQWWDINPNYNIGVAAGQGLLVLDADCKNGAKGLVSLDLLDMQGLPDSFRVATPSGGVHVYLKSPHRHRNAVKSIENCPGLDIRSDGGYVVGPGSTVDGKAYKYARWDVVEQAPDWLDDLLIQSAAKHKLAQSDIPADDLDTDRNVKRAIDYLENRAPTAVEGDGGDETTYKVAAKLRDFAISEPLALELMLEHWNDNQSPPWDPQDLETKIRNAYSYATGTPGADTAAADFHDTESITHQIDIGEPPKPKHFNDTPTPDTLAKPYVFIDPSQLPKREWLYGRHYIRKFISVTVSPGNIGKSSLVIAEALAMATGRNLIGHKTTRPLKVWYWNLEDPYEELQRRIQAAAIHFDIKPHELKDTFFVNSGRDTPLKLAVQNHEGTKFNNALIEHIKAAASKNQIDAIILDPFVSTHAVPENDNMAIDAVAKTWAKIADQTNTAIELVHHTRKASTGETETTTDSARGGKALTDAARDVRVLNRMTKEEAAKVGIENHRLYFRTYSDKANMSPPADASEWFKLNGVDLPNGDQVGVVDAWEWPDPFEAIGDDDLLRVQSALAASIEAGHIWWKNVQSKKWVGELIADVLGMDVGVAVEKEKIKQIFARWLQDGYFRTTQEADANRKIRDAVRVGRVVGEGAE